MENQEFGAIFPDNQPDPLQTFQQQREFNLQQQRYNQQMQMQKDNHDFQLIKYLGDTLDPSHYGTGTEYDTKINSGLSDIMNNATQMIKSKQSPADIAAYTQMAANQINNWAQKAKAINDNINQRSQLLAKQGINPDALTRYAKAYAFHDQNGNLKDGNSLDPNQDYTQHILDNYPQAVATDNSAINAVIKGSEKHPIRSTGSVNVNGVKRNVGYGGEYYPGFNVGVDAKGNPVNSNDTNSLITGVKVKSEQIPIDDQGNKIEVADRGVYNQFNDNQGVKIRLNGMVKAQGIDPNTPQGEIMKRKYLLDILNESGKGYMFKEKDDVDQSQLERERFSRESQLQKQQFQNEQRLLRESNKQEKAPNFAETLGKYYSGDMKDGDVDESGNINIAPMMPKGVLYSGKQQLVPNGPAKPEIYSKIKFNPTSGAITPYTLEYAKDPDTGKYIDPADGKPLGKNQSPVEVEVPQSEIAAQDAVPFIRKIATVNGTSPDEAEKAFRAHYDNSPYKLLPKPKTWIEKILNLKR